MGSSIKVPAIIPPDDFIHYPGRMSCKVKCLTGQSCIFVGACKVHKTLSTGVVRRNMNYHSKYVNLHPWSYGKANIDRAGYFTLLKVYLLTGFKCWYCGCEMSVCVQGSPDQYTIDHRIPISKGGSNNSDNMVICCATCNNIKSNIISIPAYLV